MNQGRLRAFNARLKDQDFEQHWREGIDRIAKFDFCLGKNDRGWKADVDFFLRSATLNKILEGFYDNRAGVPPASKLNRPIPNHDEGF